MKKILTIILDIIVLGVTWTGIFLIGLHLFGVNPTIVTSGSMYPTIPTGSLCFINTRYPYEDLTVGDIIVFKEPKQKVIHRIIEITETEIHTKGDANHHVDGLPTTRRNYYGKYLYSLPKIGYLIYNLQSTSGKVIFVVTLIFLYTTCYLLNKKKKEVTTKK